MIPLRSLLYNAGLTKRHISAVMYGTQIITPAQNDALRCVNSCAESFVLMILIGDTVIAVASSENHPVIIPKSLNVGKSSRVGPNITVSNRNSFIMNIAAAAAITAMMERINTHLSTSKWSQNVPVALSMGIYF